MFSGIENARGQCIPWLRRESLTNLFDEKICTLDLAIIARHRRRQNLPPPSQPTPSPALCHLRSDRCCSEHLVFTQQHTHTQHPSPTPKKDATLSPCTTRQTLGQRASSFFSCQRLFQNQNDCFGEQVGKTIGCEGTNIERSTSRTQTLQP